MTLGIRTAATTDIAAMHRIRTSVRENRLSSADRITAASYLPYVTAGTAWVAERDGAVAGFAVIDAPAQTVWALFVEPSVEGSGVGRALHDAMLRWAREHDIGYLTLSTEEGSRALNFYIRAGWLRQGITASGEVLLRKAVFDQAACPPIANISRTP